MKQPDPIDLLKSKVKEYEHDLQKSQNAYNNREINAETHLIHKENLCPLIAKYKQAILILQS
jgi:hypothetical protein